MENAQQHIDTEKTPPYQVILSRVAEATNSWTLCICYSRRSQLSIPRISDAIEPPLTSDVSALPVSLASLSSPVFDLGSLSLRLGFQAFFTEMVMREVWCWLGELFNMRNNLLGFTYLELKREPLEIKYVSRSIAVDTRRIHRICGTLLLRPFSVERWRKNNSSRDLKYTSCCRDAWLS